MRYRRKCWSTTSSAFPAGPLRPTIRPSVTEWVRVVKTYGIRRSGLQPVAVRMLLDADLPRDNLSSLEYVMSASAPLDPETRDAFEERYGLPVLLAYGATEFASSVCTWTPELYREFGAAKSLSSGRVLPDTDVRIIDHDTGAEVPTGEYGVLEARVSSISPDWIRTTDLASIDYDGFITLHGRADGAINHGGFKTNSSRWSATRSPNTVCRWSRHRRGASPHAVAQGESARRGGDVPAALRNYSDSAMISRLVRTAAGRHRRLRSSGHFRSRHQRAGFDALHDRVDFVDAQQ